MLHILGNSLIFVGMSMLGWRYAAGLRARASVLRAFLSAVECLERELSFALMPVEQLLRTLSAGRAGEVQGFFARCAEEFANRQEERLDDIWRATLPSLRSLTEEDRRLIGEIGTVLGRYDGDSQRQAIWQIHERLATQCTVAAEEAQRLGRVYTVLGVTGGIFCVLLL